MPNVPPEDLPPEPTFSPREDAARPGTRDVGGVGAEPMREAEEVERSKDA